MDYILYLVTLSILSTIFGLIWPFVGILNYVISGRNEISARIGFIINRILLTYLMAVVVGIASVIAIDKTDLPNALISITGGIFLFMWLTNSLVEQQRSMLQEPSDYYYYISNLFDWDGIYSFAVVAIFVLTLYVPTIALTSVAISFIHAIGWVLNIHIIGPLIGLYAAWNALGTIAGMGYMGIMMVGMLIYQIISWPVSFIRNRISAREEKVI